MIISKDLQKELLEQGVLSMFLKNCLDSTLAVYNTVTEVSQAFRWESTPQGFQFWYAVSRNVQLNRDNAGASQCKSR